MPSSASDSGTDDASDLFPLGDSESEQGSLADVDDGEENEFEDFKPEDEMQDSPTGPETSESKAPEAAGFLHFFRSMRCEFIEEQLEAGENPLDPDDAARLGTRMAKAWKALDEPLREVYESRAQENLEIVKERKDAEDADANPPRRHVRNRAQRATKAGKAAYPRNKSTYPRSAKSKCNFLMQLSPAALRGKLRWEGVSSSEIRCCIEKTELVSLLLEKSKKKNLRPSVESKSQAARNRGSGKSSSSTNRWYAYAFPHPKVAVVYQLKAGEPKKMCEFSGRLFLFI